jgi:hypothetical protein
MIDNNVVLTNQGPYWMPYTTLDSRIESFTKHTIFPLECYKKFAEAGFFYSSPNEITCFYCNLSFRDWYFYENPWLEHLIHNSRCAFLKLNYSNLQQQRSNNAEWVFNESLSLQANYNLCKLCL